MFGFVARLLGGAVTPIVDRLTAFGTNLLRKIVLFLVAALCMVVVIVALTIAFDLWIASLAGPIVGALAVAGLYLGIAIAAVAFALRIGSKPVERASDDSTERNAREATGAEKDAKVDQFTAPILAMLASLGLRREQIAVLAGASLAKRLGPVPLVGIAIVAGFLVGRLWHGWDALVSSDLVDNLLDLVNPTRHAHAEASEESA